jgi:hypothetical protein
MMFDLYDIPQLSNLKRALRTAAQSGYHDRTFMQIVMSDIDEEIFKRTQKSDSALNKA